MNFVEMTPREREMWFGIGVGCSFCDKYSHTEWYSKCDKCLSRFCSSCCEFIRVEGILFTLCKDCYKKRLKERRKERKEEKGKRIWTP